MLIKIFMIESCNISDLSLEQLDRCARQNNFEPYRIEQITKWLYYKRVNSIDQMSNLPDAVRQRLSKKYCCSKLKIKSIYTSSDGAAVKFVLTNQWNDKDMFEAVLLNHDDRLTLCVSSQIGCSMQCAFCATATMGFKRNLSQSEILGQVITANDYAAAVYKSTITNIVFMGMGEALLNYANLLSSVQILLHKNCFGLNGKRITISTCGLLNCLEKLFRENINIGIAISLNAVDNETRSRLMPINNTYPIQELLSFAKKYYTATGNEITFEYVLIKGFNDSQKDAHALGRLLKGIRCKVNLISLNKIQAGKFEPSNPANVSNFNKIVTSYHITTTTRKSIGSDIWAACGQLAVLQE